MKGYRMLLAGAAVAALAAPGITQQNATPIARYTMDVSTVSGIGAMGRGVGAGLSMAFGGGGGDRVLKQMELRLGSTLPATGGNPAADHFLPAAARMGRSVPLVSPTPSGPPRERRDEDLPENFQRPKGRLLIFWGCGAHAGPGQPVVIDFARLAAGQVPPGLMGGGVAIPREWAILPSNSKTYGEWPNSRDRNTLSAGSSILGDHRIAGNYSPEIKFSLNQDFMAALNPTANIGGPTIRLNWNAVPAATGYYAWLMGFQPGDDGQPKDMVWWASSNSRNFGGGLWDWLSPATVQRLIGQKIVMPASQTSCEVPQEVKAAVPQGMMIGTMYAYGPEANFAYPPRPADPRTPWRPDWTTRVRYRSSSMWMIGGPAGMGGQGENSGGNANSGNTGNNGQQEQRCRRRGGFGGLLGAVVTGQSGC